MRNRRVRPAAQAGRFYPDDVEELRSAVRALLDNAPKTPLEAFPRGFVAPHAGYVFSGPTAAHAYRQIEGADIERVVVLAPSHHAHFQGGSIYDGEAYQTPLGQVPLDLELIEELRTESRLFRYVRQADEPEHGIEVQLPFLQMALGAFRLIPILMSDQGEENSMALAGAVLKALESRPPLATLFIASSDLYHGYDYEACRLFDHRFEQSLLRFEPRRLLRETLAGDCMACGAGPVAVAMELSRQVGASQTRILHRTNSRAVNPMPGTNYIVGYAAAAFL